MIFLSNEVKRVVFVLCIIMLVAACTTPSIPGRTETTTIPFSTATFPPTAFPVLVPSPTATPSPKPTPSLTPTPDPAASCRVPGEDGRIFVISDKALQEHDVYMRLEVKDALREAIRLRYPGWAEYTQQLTFGKMVVTYDLARILVNAGLPCIHGPCPYQISVNPVVILTVMATRYGEEPPPNFDAWQTARQIALDIKRLYEENQDRPETWQDRFSNTGSYVMYQILRQREDQLKTWCVTYHTFYALTQQAIGQ